MSQFFAEAEVLIRPNTTGFAAALETQVKAAIAGVQTTLPPVVVTAAVAPVGTVGAVGAQAALAEATSASTAASEAKTAAMTAEGAATEKTAVATASLARVEALSASQLGLVTAAADAASVATTNLARAAALHAGTVRVAARSQEVFAVALQTSNVELQAAAALGTFVAGVNERTALSVHQLAAAEVEEAAASRAGTRAHSQYIRGTQATGLSLLGIRGATLAASSAFLAGAASVTIAAKSISAASDRVEQLNKSVEVFAESAPQVQKWSETTATAMGISQTAALSAASTYGQLFRTLGTGPAEAAQLSERLVQLASDLASFNNVSVDRALQAIQSGLVGQARPLRALGVFLTEARVKQEAMAESGKKSATALTQQDKILARYNLILRDAALATGDFQRTQERLANQSRILSAQMSNLAADIGATITPAVTGLVQDVNILIGAFEKLGKVKIKLPKVEEPKGQGTLGQLNDLLGGIPGNFVKNLAPNFLIPGLAFNIESVKLLHDGIQALGRIFLDTTPKAGEVAGAIENIGHNSIITKAAVDQLSNSLQGLQHGADVLTQQQEQIQAGVLPGGRAAEEKNLAAQIAAQQKIIDTAKVGSKAYRDALREKKRLMDELAGLQAQDAADAKATAQKIQTARDKADQAIQDAITRATGKADLRKTIAAGTAQTLDDLNAAIHERAVIRQLIRTLVPRIKDEQTRAAVLAQLRLAEVQANNEVKALQEERRKARVAARQAAIDARETHLQAMLSIAETTVSSKDDLTALRALQAFYQRRIAELKKIKHRNQEQNAALDAYRVSLAQTNESIRNITKEAQKGNTFAQQAFAFLQTQQGFVSNLLGNLIPGGLTGGLVGGQPSVPSNAPHQVAGGFEQPRGVNFTAGEAVRTRPPSAQQSERQIDWLRKIYAALVDLKRGSEHPEAKNQRRTGSSAMDFHIQGTYGM